jgi:hypothetical protein
MSDTLEQEYMEVDGAFAALKEANMLMNGHREKAQIALRIATDHYNELKTHVQDVLRDADLWDDFDTEKLARHGIVKPPTTYSCEYEVKYTGTITVKADSEESARSWADEIVTNGISCQLPDIEHSEITDQTHNDFDVEINGCEEQ